MIAIEKPDDRVYVERELEDREKLDPFDLQTRFQRNVLCSKKSGGEGGIRTPGEVLPSQPLSRRLP